MQNIISATVLQHWSVVTVFYMSQVQVSACVKIPFPPVGEKLEESV